MDFIIVPDPPGCLCYPLTASAMELVLHLDFVIVAGAAPLSYGPKAVFDDMTRAGFTAEIQPTYKPTNHG